LEINICGIDEAGRGCIAGSMVVAGVVLYSNIDGLRDSKKLSEKRREELYEIIIKNSLYKIVSISSRDIDEFGISKSLNFALNEIKKYISTDRYIFDGNCSYKVDNIETIIKGDDKVPQISAASILAKVTRDREICSYNMPYSFDKHKGYGTKQHYEEIAKFGISNIHRKSFLKTYSTSNLID
jgi:ribonuclease HII